MSPTCTKLLGQTSLATFWGPWRAKVRAREASASGAAAATIAEPSAAESLRVSRLFVVG